MRIQKIFFICLVTIWGYTAYGQYAQAMKAYNNKQYKEAIEFWNIEIKHPKANKAMAYAHIGDAYFQLKEYPYAILNYEKSLRKNYNQDEIKYNLHVARARLGLDTESKEMFYTIWAKKLVFLIPQFGLQIILIVLGWFVLFVAILRRWKPISWYLTAWRVLIGSIVLAGICLWSQMSYQSESNEGIIMQANSLGYDDLSMRGVPKSMKLGEKYNVLDRLESKLKVKSIQDSIYWISAADIALI